MQNFRKVRGYALISVKSNVKKTDCALNDVQQKQVFYGSKLFLVFKLIPCYDGKKRIYPSKQSEFVFLEYQRMVLTEKNY